MAGDCGRQAPKGAWEEVRNVVAVLMFFERSLVLTKAEHSYSRSSNKSLGISWDHAVVVGCLSKEWPKDCSEEIEARSWLRNAPQYSAAVPTK